MRPAEDIEVYLCREVVDFRKSINGLSVIVEEQLGLSPFGPQLFVFCNRRRDKLKILYWERSGLEPFAYLRHVLAQLPSATTFDEVEAMLPHRIDPARLQDASQFSSGP
jgi:hypothetical protein